MSIPVTHTPAIATEDDAEHGFGALRTERGNLPLHAVDVAADITGTAAAVRLTQRFRNAHDVALEATYVFPLPDRAAVTALRMTVGGRTVRAELAERGQARQRYDDALDAGHGAAIAEEERPDVFTLRVGNIGPGEDVVVELRLVQPLAVEEGEAVFRFPLVVAPRYIPGEPLDGTPVGDGTAPDTDAVPDASRISPPVLLPGFPNPVDLDLAVTVDPAGLPVRELHSSLHLVTSDPADDGEGAATPESVPTTTLRLRPGERLDRDFVLRFALAGPDAVATAAHLTRDDDADPGTAASAAAGAGVDSAGSPADDDGTGTFSCTIVPPREEAPPRPRDVVLLLDQSGSMQGWKMVAARRAAARIVDTLTPDDRFAVLGFHNRIVDYSPLQLTPGTDRHRFHAISNIAGARAGGGTRLLPALHEAVYRLTNVSHEQSEERDRILVLVTDGQVGNEDQILTELSQRLGHARVHTVGIDTAVNAGFLNRLAALGQGRCELVESEDQLDAAMTRIHRRIGAPVLTGVTLSAEGLEILPDTVTPSQVAAAHADVLGRSGDTEQSSDTAPAGTRAQACVYPGVPLTVRGRWRGEPAADARLRLGGVTAAGREWEQVVTPRTTADPAAATLWAGTRLRELEDDYAVAHVRRDVADLERAIVAFSLRHGLLSRFTAFLAVTEEPVTDGPPRHRVIQPVERPRGWQGERKSRIQEGSLGRTVMVHGAREDGDGVAMPLSGGSFERAPAPPAYPRTPPGPLPPPAPPGPPPPTAPGAGADADDRGPAAAGAESLSSRPSGDRASRSRSRPAFRASARPAATARGPRAPHRQDTEERVRAELREEARRLRDTPTRRGDARERRDVLSDLGSRLAVALARLRALAVPEERLTELAALVEELRRCDDAAAIPGDELAALWERAERALSRDTEGEGENGPRRPFWKKR